MVTPSLATPPANIRLRFDITDSDGLHQAQLFLPVRDSVIACQTLSGNQASVEFVTNELVDANTILLRVIDVNGNFTSYSFPIDITDLLPPSEVVSIPDPNLAAALRETLGLAPGTPITQIDMLRLTRFIDSDFDYLYAADLTGFQHAIKMRDLGFLNGKQISDITPLAGLANMVLLTIENSTINDITPLAELTNLRLLHLSYNKISDITPVTGLTRLFNLGLHGNQISDITPLAGLTELTDLSLSGNQINNVSPLAGMIYLNNLYLHSNEISDVSPLMGLNLTQLNLRNNPLNYISVNTHIPALQARGVEVNFHTRTPHRIRIVSGNDRQGMPDATLAKPFVVEIQDQRDVAFEGVPVIFTITAGGGTLSKQTTTTDSNGRAESILTLGPNPGENTVTVSVTGTQEQRTFNAEGSRTPKELEIISGADQEGLPGDALEKPFVVEVRDQTDKPLPGVTVTFSITSGDGMLSATSGTTDSNGQAESTLTLGPNPGTNTVEATVTGIEEKRAFNAEGTQIPKTLGDSLGG